MFRAPFMKRRLLLAPLLLAAAAAAAGPSFDPLASRVTGSALRDASAGDGVQLVLDARDRRGTRLPDQGGALPAQPTAYLRGPIDSVGNQRQTFAFAKNNATNTLETRYAVTRAGQYVVTVRANGMHIDPTPTFVRVFPGPPDLTRSEVAYVQDGEAGRTASFTVSLQDQYGNAVARGMSAYAPASARGPSLRFEGTRIEGLDLYDGCTTMSPGCHEVIPLGASLRCFPQNGRIRCDYEAHRSGSYRVLFVINTMLLETQPRFAVNPGPISEHGSTLGGASRAGSRAGQELLFNVDLRDEFGNDPDPTDARNFLPNVWMGGTVTNRHADDAHLAFNCTQSNATEFRFECTSYTERAGTLELGVYINGKPMADSPYQIYIAPAITSAGAGHTEVQELCSGLVGSVVGAENRFRLIPRDRFGNRQVGPPDPFRIVAARCEGFDDTRPTNASTQCTGRLSLQEYAMLDYRFSRERLDGAFTVKYKFNELGWHALTISLLNEVVADADALLVRVVERAGRVSVPHSTFEEWAERTVAGRDTEVIVQARDENCWPVRSGGLRLALSAEPMEGVTISKADDRGDGTYVMRWSSVRVGAYNLSAHDTDGRAVATAPPSTARYLSTMPQTSVVADAVHPSSSRWILDRGRYTAAGITAVVAGEHVYALLIANDRFGNNARDLFVRANGTGTVLIRGRPARSPGAVVIEAAAKRVVHFPSTLNWNMTKQLSLGVLYSFTVARSGTYAFTLFLHDGSEVPHSANVPANLEVVPGALDANASGFDPTDRDLLGNPSVNGTADAMLRDAHGNRIRACPACLCEAAVFDANASACGDASTDVTLNATAPSASCTLVEDGTREGIIARVAFALDGGGAECRPFRIRTAITTAQGVTRELGAKDLGIIVRRELSPPPPPSPPTLPPPLPPKPPPSPFSPLPILLRFSPPPLYPSAPPPSPLSPPASPNAPLLHFTADEPRSTGGNTNAMLGIIVAVLATCGVCTIAGTAGIILQSRRSAWNLAKTAADVESGLIATPWSALESSKELEARALLSPEKGQRPSRDKVEKAAQEILQAQLRPSIPMEPRTPLARPRGARVGVRLPPMAGTDLPARTDTARAGVRLPPMEDGPRRPLDSAAELQSHGGRGARDDWRHAVLQVAFDVYRGTLGTASSLRKDLYSKGKDAAMSAYAIAAPILPYGVMSTPPRLKPPATAMPSSPSTRDSVRSILGSPRILPSPERRVQTAPVEPGPALAEAVLVPLPGTAPPELEARRLLARYDGTGADEGEGSNRAPPEFLLPAELQQALASVGFGDDGWPNT